MKTCPTCTTEFTPKNGNQKFCSKPCKRKAYQVNGGVESTERQYQLISGNWERYFGRLCNRSFNRSMLSKQDCIKLLEQQDYKCALTGETLTCKLERGVVCKTNASIDRINPKGAYELGNIQLVCAVINKLRIDMDIYEFKDWCRKVADYAIR